jgi:D-alanyl-D-alanine carboxypeptidase
VLRAKTGSLDDVVALAGTVDAGRRPDFAFIANGPLAPGTASELQAAVAHVVASYPAHIDTADLVPAP